ncbi:MAG: hypothetical protein M3Q65_15705 [Chloroflexota bacterium]|nr:hypothetical protein [Chloroflexota bacterium]
MFTLYDLECLTELKMADLERQRLARRRAGQLGEIGSAPMAILRGRTAGALIALALRLAPSLRETDIAVRPMRP